MNFAWAPMASILAQVFPPHSRQTSLSISYSIGAAIWGGLAPVTATALYQATDTIWSAIILYFAMTAISIVCLALAPQRIDEVFEEDVLTARALREANE